MKKLFRSALISALILSSQAALAQDTAVYFDHTYDYTYARYDINREVSPILIIDTVGKKVQTANGINIIIPTSIYALWDKAVQEVTLEGTAVTAGKMDAKLKPIYSENLRTVFLPVKMDFAANEQVSISGLKLRVYGTANDKRRLGLDINADKVADFDNFRTIIVSGTEIRTDFLPPYPVTEGSINYKEGKITLTWKDSPDLDLSKIAIQRELIRDGKFSVKLFDVGAGLQTFVDDGFLENDQVTYKITAKDQADNGSELLTLSTAVKNVVITTPPIEVPVVVKQENPIPPAKETMVEKQNLPDETLIKPESTIDTGSVQNVFTDIQSNHWAFGALNNLYDLKIIGGYPDKTIRPDLTISRAEIAKMAYQAFMADSGIKETKMSFKDVKNGEWYYSVIAKMVTKGVFTGYKDKTFRPHAKVTRAEVIKILVAAANMKSLKEEAQMPSFKDISKNAWYLRYLNIALENKFISGFSDDTFRPDAPATRAEVAMMVNKILLLQAEK